jgi:Protein of unknown function (DUF4232)
VTACSGSSAVPATRSTTSSSLAITVPSTAAQSVSSVAPCRNGQIAVSKGSGGVAAGHTDEVILFSNNSNSSCSTSGYPGVAGLDAQGAQVTQAKRTPSGFIGGLQPGPTMPPQVTLSPGQTASAIVEGTDVPISGATTCTSYPYLLITPPNLTDSVRVISPLSGCSPIEVHPIVPGSTGSTK